jgi:hypothetical protein
MQSLAACGTPDQQVTGQHPKQGEEAAYGG